MWKFEWRFTHNHMSHVWRQVERWDISCTLAAFRAAQWLDICERNDAPVEVRLAKAGSWPTGERIIF